MSMSMSPIWVLGSEREKDCARRVVKVDLPTPPLPERMRSLCLMLERRDIIAGRSGSGPFGVVAQICWLGQPAQAS